MTTYLKGRPWFSRSRLFLCWGLSCGALFQLKRLSQTVRNFFGDGAVVVPCLADNLLVHVPVYADRCHAKAVFVFRFVHFRFLSLSQQRAESGYPCREVNTEMRDVIVENDGAWPQVTSKS
jgi:hypothetical protein